MLHGRRSWEKMVAAVTVGAVWVIKLELFEFLGEIQDIPSLQMVLFDLP